MSSLFWRVKGRSWLLSSIKFNVNRSISMTSGMNNPKKINTDLIGPADPVSNLRPVVFKISDKESPLEKKLRLQREEVQKWNQNFWWHHNNNFYKQKQEYIQRSALRNETGSTEKNALTTKEMSTFYKDFLDKNWEVHRKYNVEWYKKNFKLLLLSYRVKWEGLVRKFFPVHD
ncbi:COA8 family protein CG14806, mitochondrial [Ischnura elegans]|uniref:COA8 family protein CG14806, mitochondrial n=1 Tax=Ischnura elegans TaxID=197161 RepID=UPI001ED8A267|nr:COA8 family protein CG14806, mitochondrial [Ischnura elegans]XP_046390609.1 COA8 family protein CG14806, mitochondrial [Ischnura elegans]